MTLQKLYKYWNKYSSDFRPSAFWFWNDEMTEKSMEQTIKRMSESKIREVLFHPSHGLSVPFLSEEFFEKIRYALSLAGQYNLKVWIYDDYGWPTGALGGKFLEAYPEYVMKFLGFCDGIPKVMTCKRLHDGNMGASWCKNTLGYIDTLNKEAIKLFLKMNYEKYKEETGELWKTVKGFFTDEPAIMMAYDFEDFSKSPALPWTDSVPGEFRKKYNYDIEPFYKDLFSPGYSKYKEDYFNLVVDLHTEAYFKQISNWCRKEGKEWTGHVREDSFKDQVRFGGNIYKSLSCMTYPGVDYLNQKNVDENYEIEIVSSIAKAQGKNKVYMEAFGISPYSLTLSQMYYKIQSIACQRVNDIALMGWENSSKGIRKRAYWAPMQKDAPWYYYYPYFSDFAARVMAISNMGEEKRQIAILYPQYEIQMCVNDLDSKGDKKEEIEEKFIFLVNKIYDLGYEFDWVFPENFFVDTVRTYDYFFVLKDFSYSVQTTKILNETENKSNNIIWDYLKNIDLCSNPEISFMSCDFNHRVYIYEYTDGKLYSVRNTDKKIGKINVDTNKNITLWRPDKNEICYVSGEIEIKPNESCYFSLTDIPIAFDEMPKLENKPIKILWDIKAVSFNTAPLTDVCAKHNEKGFINLSFLPAKETPLGVFYGALSETNENCLPMLPLDFFGYTEIKCKASFYVENFTQLGLLFEKDYFSSLVLNNKKVDLTHLNEVFVWDQSNRVIDLSDKIQLGNNYIEFTLNFEKYETTFKNNGFFSFGPMPSVDVALIGDFVYKNNKVMSYTNDKKYFPIDLSKEGFAHTYGNVRLTGTFEKTDQMNYISLDIIGSPVCELFIDNVQIGVNMTDYIYNIKNVSKGKHEISFVITGTSASLFDYKNNNVFKINKIVY